jgi:hypothetical protein
MSPRVSYDPAAWGSSVEQGVRLVICSGILDNNLFKYIIAPIAVVVISWAIIRFIKYTVTYRLSSIEKELLIEAFKNNCEILLIETDDLDWIRIGARDFIFKEDPAERIKHRDALDRLERMGYVRQAGKSLHQLTSEGIERAKRLSSKGKPK